MSLEASFIADIVARREMEELGGVIWVSATLGELEDEGGEG